MEDLKGIPMDGMRILKERLARAGESLEALIQLRESGKSLHPAGLEMLISRTRAKIEDLELIMDEYKTCPQEREIIDDELIGEEFDEKFHLQGDPLLRARRIVF